ncbi:MAG: class I SAM-dependent methyltransferase [Bacteroidales bacterium]|nr:class I SAM-dependent methyltransferase [Bacteroidales bacterium]
MPKKKIKLADVFIDVNAHITSSEIILAHSTNKNDIREIALKNLNLLSSKNILDLGCGFGFFTRALKNKVCPDATITGLDCFKEYKNKFLNSCTESGFKGKFNSSGISALNKFESNSFDLILCSYALYFFPESISEISRIMKNNSIFIVITHNKSHLKEITKIINNFFIKNNIYITKELPHDKLIENFSGENGYMLLKQYIGNIKKIEYKNSLFFNIEYLHNFIEYFRFKKSFFIPGDLYYDNKLMDLIENNLNEQIKSKKRLLITKNDTIFVCTQPF